MKLKGYELFVESKMWMTRIKDIKNYISNSDMIDDIWVSMSDYCSPDYNNGNVEIKFSQIDKDRDRGYKIPELYVCFLLHDKESIEYDNIKELKSGKPTHIMSGGNYGCVEQPLEILKGHSCYDELKNANSMTLSSLNIDSYKFLIMKASNDPWTSHTNSDKAFYCEIHYELTEAFLKSVIDRLKYGDHNNDSGRYYDLVKNKEDLKEDPIVNALKGSVDRRKIYDGFREIYIELLSYGFKSEHIIDKARELDLDKCTKAGCSSREIFFVMCMTGEYGEMDYLGDFSPGYFFYAASQPDINLGYDLLLPAFKHCMGTELLWVESEDDKDDLLLLFLLMEPKLLKTHVEDENGESRDKWIEMLRDSFNNVAENLIALNRKESLNWLVKLIKEKDVDVDSKEAVKKFIGDYDLHLRRIKADFSGKVKWHEVTPVQKGKFKEAPDFGFFEQKINELREYIA